MRQQPKKTETQILEITNEEHFKKIEDGLYEQVDQSLFSEGILEDGNDKIFMPQTFRLHNSYECAQLMRFWIAINWMRESHQKNVPIKAVLDLGCSHSKLYQMFYNNGNFMNWPHINYYGVDADKKRLLKGRFNIKKKKLDKLIHVIGDISQILKFPEKMQVVVSMETFEHIPKFRLKNLFKTARNNLDTGGVFIISGENPDHNKGEHGVYRDSDHNHYYEWSMDEIKELSIKRGFIIEKCITLHAKNTYGRINHSTELKSIYEKLRVGLPTSIVNNICALLDTDNPYNGKQWMMFLVKK